MAHQPLTKKTAFGTILITLLALMVTTIFVAPIPVEPGMNMLDQLVNWCGEINSALIEHAEGIRT